MADPRIEALIRSTGLEDKKEGIRYLTSAEIDDFCRIQVQATRKQMQELRDWRARSLNELGDIVLCAT